MLDLPSLPKKSALPVFSLIREEDTLQEVKKKQNPKQFLAHLNTLKEGGFNVPDLMYQMAQEQVWEIDGVRVVYHCFHCGRREILYVPAKEVTCGLGCGQLMKIVWKSKAQAEVPWNL